jgi:hypothetical protein
MSYQNYKNVQNPVIPIIQQPNANNQPIRGELNNGILNSTHAMPMKNLTSDNDATFGLNRMLFFRSYQPPVNYLQPQVGKEVIQRQSVGIHHGFILDGPKTAKQKKWIGGNRDASDIISRKRVIASGTVLSKTGDQSFKNPNDNNPRIEALARVRGGGACVPKKVTNRPAFEPSGPTYYRIISAGKAAMNLGSGLVNLSSSTANGVSPGFYIITNNKIITLANVTSSSFKRSYNVLTIDRTNGSTTFNSYDIFDYANKPDESPKMINQLNNLTSSVIVIISTYYEPKSNNGPLSQNFVYAMKRCGASKIFGSENATYLPGNYFGFIQYRSAYVLVGIPGIGEDGGLERYVGDATATGDPNAVIDLMISVSGGINKQYTRISG